MAFPPNSVPRRGTPNHKVAKRGSRRRSLFVLPHRDLESRRQRRRRGHGGDLLAFETALNHYRTKLVVVVEHLAMQALDAFVRVDVPLRMDRLHGAFVAAALTGVPALAIAP